MNGDPVTTDLTIVRRAEWGARAPRTPETKMTLPVHNAYIHHAAARQPTTVAEEMEELRAEQAYHMDARGWNDIGYSFSVGPSGRIYECRADFIGAHTSGHNADGFGICFQGSYETTVPTPAATLAAASLLVHLERVGALSHGYTILGHRDVFATACPGQMLYNNLPQLRQLAAALTQEITAMPDNTPLDYKVNARPVSIAITPSGHGYVILCRDGGVITFGDAEYHGRVSEGQPGAWHASESL